MMNLDYLRERIAKQYIEVTTGAVENCHGDTWRIGKLWAADSIRLGKLLGGVDADSSDNDERLAPYYAALLSKTLLDEAGGHPYDSDEGRALLEKLDCLIELGLAATEFNTSKKK